MDDNFSKDLRASIAGLSNEYNTNHLHGMIIRLRPAITTVALWMRYTVMLIKKSLRKSPLIFQRKYEPFYRSHMKDSRL